MRTQTGFPVDMEEYGGRGALFIGRWGTGLLGFGDLRIGTFGGQMIFAVTRATAIASPVRRLGPFSDRPPPSILLVRLGPVPDSFVGVPPLFPAYR